MGYPLAFPDIASSPVRECPAPPLARLLRTCLSRPRVSCPWALIPTACVLHRGRHVTSALAALVTVPPGFVPRSTPCPWSAPSIPCGHIVPPGLMAADNIIFAPGPLCLVAITPCRPALCRGQPSVPLGVRTLWAYRAACTRCIGCITTAWPRAADRRVVAPWPRWPPPSILS